MLRKALIDKTSGTVIGVLEVSEKGFGKLTAGKGPALLGLYPVGCSTGR